MAQGEGPRVYPPAPVGTNVLSVTWMDLESNMNFAGNILIPDADVQSTIFALNYSCQSCIRWQLDVKNQTKYRQDEC